jgi:hypothetical protein
MLAQQLRLGVEVERLESFWMRLRTHATPAKYSAVSGPPARGQSPPSVAHAWKLR